MQFFQRLQTLRANSSEPESLRALLALYWRMLLAVAFILTIIVFAYGGWQLTSVLNDRTIAQPDDSSPGAQKPAIDSVQADAVLQGFAARQARFEALKTKAPAIADPSQ